MPFAQMTEDRPVLFPPSSPDRLAMQREMLAALKEPQRALFGIADVMAAFELLDKSRIQPTIGDGCRYEDPGTKLPSCIAGTIISILAPSYFNAACRGDAGAIVVHQLPSIDGVFDQGAIRLLTAVQEYADGRQSYALAVGDREENKRTWGDAMLYGATDLLRRMF